MDSSSQGRTVVGDVVPARGSIGFAWAVSSAVLALSFVATLVVMMLLLAPVAVHGDLDNPLGVQWDSWASWVSLGGALLVGTMMITAGGGSGLVWRWAELRVLDRSGADAGWVRRASRPLVLGAAVLACLSLLHDMTGLVLGIGLVVGALGTALLAPDRRGVVERLLGLRDVAWGQVPAPADHPVTT